MTFEEVLNVIADIVVWTFEHVLEPLGNIPNVLFIILGFVGLFTWLNIQKKYNKKAEEDGGLE